MDLKFFKLESMNKFIEKESYVYSWMQRLKKKFVKVLSKKLIKMDTLLLDKKMD